MEKEKPNKIIGVVSIEDALKQFASTSKENENLLRRTEKINDIVNAIADKRHRLNLSQRDLAEITGIKQPMIARFEKLEMFPRIDTLLRITEALDLDFKIVEKDWVEYNIPFKNIKYKEYLNIVDGGYIGYEQSTKAEPSYAA